MRFTPGTFSYLIPARFLFEDLKKSKQKDYGHCAVSECLRRTFHVDEVYTGRKYGYVFFKDKCVKYRVSTALQREIELFDRSKDATALGSGKSFTLLPFPAGEIDRKRPGRKRNPKAKKAGPFTVRHIIEGVRGRKELAAISVQ